METCVYLGQRHVSSSSPAWIHPSADGENEHISETHTLSAGSLRTGGAVGRGLSRTGSAPWGRLSRTGSSPWGRLSRTGSSPWGRLRESLPELFPGLLTLILGFPEGTSGQEAPANAGDVRDEGSIPGSGRFPWRSQWQPTPEFLTGKPYGQKNLEGYSPQGCKESHTTECVRVQTHKHPLILNL